MISHHRTSSRGFSITELLAALLLLVVFFAVAGQIFRSTVLLSSASQTVCDEASSTDSLLRQLRTDAWNSRAIATPDAHSAQLSRADGGDITWKIVSGDSVLRTDATGHQQTWTVAAAHWSFAAGPNSLLITDDKNAPQRLVSQVLLAEASPR